MATNTQGPWAVDSSNGNYIAVRECASGNVICLLPTDTAIRPLEETVVNAELISRALDLLYAVVDFVEVNRCFVDFSRGEAKAFPTIDEFCSPLECAEFLLDEMVVAGIPLVMSKPNGMVVIPLPMMTTPAEVVMFKVSNGDVNIVVQTGCKRKTTIGQWNISSTMHGFVHTFLSEDGPLCGVLRHGKKVVGEITFLPGHLLKLTLGDCSLTTELEPDDTRDIINLFRER